MYKKLSYDQLLKLKSWFFESLSSILKKNKYQTLKDYLHITSKQGEVVYHIARQEYIWRTVFVHGSDQVIFYDEREKIELHADKAILAKIGALIRDTKKIAAQKKSAVSIEQTLLKAFDEGKLSDIAGKGYLVYDIETSYTTNDLKKTEFYIGYAYIVQGWKGMYKYIDKSNLTKFLEYLIDFDGYIIGFNSLAFDNPVTVHQWLTFADRYSDEEYERLLALVNKKSLDIFQFVWWITGKRMGLNKLSRSLVGLGKTLESGKESENLRQTYLEGDENALKILNNYCKNDVKMTYLSLWYILYFQKLSLDDQDHEYTIEEFIALSNKEQVEEDLSEQNDKSHTIFSE